MSKQDTFARESHFHDEWATGTDAADIDVDAAFFSPTAMENRFILERLGDLRGKHVLDIGCGLGETAVMFARRGALVTASDISPQMIQVTEQLARRYGVSIATRVGPAESVDLPAGGFDVVFTANTLHHLADRGAFLRSVMQLLKPDGVFCSWDPIKYNPVIEVYRRIATEVRSADERPLGCRDVKEIAGYFSETETQHFWLLSLALFLKYFLWDRISPNQERYWKRILHETDRSLWWWRPLRAMDKGLLKLPLVRWLSWNVVVIAKSPRADRL